MQEFALIGVFVVAVIIVGLASGILGIFLDPKDGMFWSWLAAVVIAAASIVNQYAQSLPT